MTTTLIHTRYYGGGTPLTATGQEGSTTLLFRNKHPDLRGYYLLTCSHLCGAVTQPTIAETHLSLNLPSQGKLQTEIIYRATTSSNTPHLAYDIALTRIRGFRGSLQDGRIANSSDRVHGILPADHLRPGLRLQCAFPHSLIAEASISATRRTLKLQLGPHLIRVANLFQIDRQPHQGDSGGLLYCDGLAAGILIAITPNSGLFQPLSEALDSIRNATGLTLQPF